MRISRILIDLFRKRVTPPVARLEEVGKADANAIHEVTDRLQKGVIPHSQEADLKGKRVLEAGAGGGETQPPQRSEAFGKICSELTETFERWTRGAHPEITSAGGTAGVVQPRSRLLSAEEDALEGYSAFDFAGHNRALRAGGPLGDWRGEQIEHIRTALEKLPDHKGVVYRGTHLPDDILALHQKGNVVRDLAFLSAAANPHARFPGNAQFRIVSRTGKDISGYTIKKEEQEVLFKEETPFEVVNRKDTVEGGYKFSYIDLVERDDLA